MTFRYKERPLTFNFSWKWTVFHVFLFCWMIKILLFLWRVSEATVQYHRHVYPIRNCLFVRFSVTLFKPEKPLKVPEVKKFYKHFGSRAVVEFLINTVFAASCFLVTLLVAFAQIKDSYKSVRCSATIVSICIETLLYVNIRGQLFENSIFITPSTYFRYFYHRKSMTFSIHLNSYVIIIFQVFQFTLFKH